MPHALPDPDAQPEFYDGVQVKRLIAWVIDTLVIFVLALIATVLTVFVGLLFFPLLMLVIGFVYRTATLASGSATWGMRLMAVELRARSGARIDGWTALAHTLLYAISIGTFLVQAVSVLLMLITPRGQGLGDHLLGTVLINRRAA
ncbi:RDD family protein [Roseovarius spongiae]|uniref:RDD family protein n=2 Tax=Roseovarius spongiae TaxID=2320272 RepID=A0A3A8AW85_9RHOB|nr:RDD family protein [Roseovarius spongiae]